ncbi:hypothetical protein Ddye_029707 [Dipteronia dyeriana]|uniref:Clathrin light chain n=1 Tax=Dipteronia dyeriana TaxID=168575 RepID=A0AAD9TG68_9ROSI|nr:hypothetical protein Ddye_029707 [Dipteronia dyeriana]
MDIWTDLNLSLNLSSAHIFILCLPLPPLLLCYWIDGPITEWTRDNAIRLEEKEKKERAMLSQIIEQAHEYKDEFYRKRVVTCHNNKLTNRERELLFVANQNKFYDEADKNYWMAIAELLPNEVPTIEIRKVKKDK